MGWGGVGVGCMIWFVCCYCRVLICLLQGGRGREARPNKRTTVGTAPLFPVLCIVNLWDYGSERASVGDMGTTGNYCVCVYSHLSPRPQSEATNHLRIREIKGKKQESTERRNREQKEQRQEEGKEKEPTSLGFLHPSFPLPLSHARDKND